MTKEEMIARLEQLEKWEFLLSMKDRWDNKDYDKHNIWLNERLKLKKVLEEG